MKNVFLLFIVFLTADISFSQSYFQSGLFNISGEASLSFSTSEQEYLGDITRNEIKFAPTVSYFLLDRFSIGLEFSYNYSEKSSGDPVHLRNIGMYLGFGPVIKYYFLNNIVSPFIKAGFSQNIFNITDSYSQDRKSFPGYSAVIGVGLNYFCTNNLAIDTSLDYVYSQKQIEMDVNNDSFFINSNNKTIKLSIGLLYFL
jgi:outer membrane protein W